MNQQQTIEKMKQMRLGAMAERYHQAISGARDKDCTTDQLIAELVDCEWEHRYNKRIQGLIKQANFRSDANIQNIDHTANRSLDRNMFERLSTLDFISRAQNIIITGATGTGKSYIAQAIGNQACLMQRKTLYFNFARLSDMINIANLEGNYLKLLKKIEKTDLLIIDDFGLSPFNDQIRNALMDIIEMKYDRSSIIIAAQLPVKSWHETIGEGTIADAILDRLVNSSHRIELTGESLRKNKLKDITIYS